MSKLGLAIMVKLRFLPLIILLLLPFTHIALAQEQFEEIWSKDSRVTDLDVSKDGSRVVMVNDTGIFCFEVLTQQLLWNVNIQDNGGPTIVPRQIVTSADGGGTVVLIEASGENVTAFGIVYVNSTGQPRWMSLINGTQYLPPNKGKLIDISDDGDYVAAALNNYTGGETEYYPRLHYWNESSTYTPESDKPRNATWHDDFSPGYNVNYTTSLDLSDDGSTVAIGTVFSDTYKAVLFYPDADDPTITSPNNATSGVTVLTSRVNDVAVSDNGYSAAAVTPETEDYAGGGTLYYWSNVPSLIEESTANWTRQHPFQCVDISGDGDAVVTGTPDLVPCGIHYWDGVLPVDGEYNYTEDWTRRTGVVIPDVAISEDGEIIAATGHLEGDYWVFFYDDQGNSLGEFDVESGDTILEMSGDGSIVAVGGAPYDSLYVYKQGGLTEAVGGEILPLNNTTTILIVLATLIASIAIGIKIKPRRYT
ncbi:MAG: hypothetical protein ACLFVP_05445 [Candidatus Bathyarchaeia archaeon]